MSTINRLARKKEIRREVYIDNQGNTEVDFLIDNLIYTSQNDSYTLPDEIAHYISKVDFEKDKHPILTYRKYFQQFYFCDDDKPKIADSFHDEEGVLLAKNISQCYFLTEGYKLYLLPDSNPQSGQSAFLRMGLFWFSNWMGGHSSPSCIAWEQELQEYKSHLVKKVNINSNWVCTIAKSPYKVTICGSNDFIDEMAKAAEYLSQKGITVYLPDPLKNETDYEQKHGKRALLKVKPPFTFRHFRKIEQSDAVLILNLKKNGIYGYFGSNTLMELSVAFYLGKHIYFLNNFNDDHPHYEEIAGLEKTILDGDLDRIHRIIE